MEELQEAIEDAQYMNAILSDGVPRPTESWKFPTDEQLNIWWDAHLVTNRHLETLEGVLSQILGFWQFYQFCRSDPKKEALMNFIVRIINYKKLRSLRSRKTNACRIYFDFFHEGGHLHKYVFNEATVKRKPSDYKYANTPAAVASLHQKNFEAFAENRLGVKTKLLEDIKGKCEPLMETLAAKGEEAEMSETFVTKKLTSEEQPESIGVAFDDPSTSWCTMFFDDVEAVAIHELEVSMWPAFLASDTYKKFRQFLYLQHQPVKESDFTLFRILGRGGFGLVNGCKRCTTGKLYAMKVMHKKRVKLQRAERLCLSEMKVLSMVESPFVVCLKYAFVSDQDLFLILDLMTGGDLAYHLSQNQCFTHIQATYLAGRTLLGIAAIHSFNLVYRDLKPDNVLVDERGLSRISDLGLATEVTPTLSGACGTRGYWAPEMLRRDSQGRKQTYDHRVDWFSFGALVYEFICGVCPFRTEAAKHWGGHPTGKECMDQAILEMEPDFSDSRFDEHSIDFCRKLLEKNPDRRLGAKGADEIMAHPWFDVVDWDHLKSGQQEPPLKPKKDINAASQSEIGQFSEDKRYKKVELSQEDHDVYRSWQYTSAVSFQSEVVEFLKYEAEQGPIVPDHQESICCCLS